MPVRSNLSEETSEYDGARVEEARVTGSIRNFMAARKLATSMLVLRIYVLILTVQYVFFATGFNMDPFYHRVLLANAVVCCMRLHQRVPSFKLNRKNLALMMEEDSAQYLLYSIAFLTSTPVTIVLMPLVVFALLHACSFLRQVFDVHGVNSYPFLRKIINSVAKNQTWFYRFVAGVEIVIFPTLFLMVIAGKPAYFALAIYYKLLHFRYLSKRNPYSRIMFYEMSIKLKQYASDSSCPGFVKMFIYKVISVVSKLAPALPKQAAEEGDGLESEAQKQ